MHEVVEWIGRALFGVIVLFWLIVGLINWVFEVPSSLKKIATELEKLNKSWEGKK